MNKPHVIRDYAIVKVKDLKVGQVFIQTLTILCFSIRQTKDMLKSL